MQMGALWAPILRLIIKHPSSWCRGRDLNPYPLKRGLGPQPSASAYSATSAWCTSIAVPPNYTCRPRYCQGDGGPYSRWTPPPGASYNRAPDTFSPMETSMNDQHSHP